MLCVLAIRLLLAFALPGDLGGVPDPQLKAQFRQQSLEPARMSTGFHPHPHLLSLGRELTVELLRCLGMVQSPLLQFPSFRIHKSNLLKGRVVICSYNDHVRLLSPGPFGWFAPPKFTRVQGADIVMESITLRRKSRLNPFGINRPWKCGFHLHGWAAGPWELTTRSMSVMLQPTTRACAQ